MGADKRLQNWILTIAILLVAIIAPLYKISKGTAVINQGIDLVGGVDMLLLAHPPESEKKVTPEMVSGAIDILRNRLDPEGVKEITIQRMGEDRIVVQIPGEDDPERVKRMIGATAILRFINAGTDPIPQGTQLRFIDVTTGLPIETFGSLEEPAPEEPKVELPPSTIMAEQVLFMRGDMVGFSLSVAQDEVQGQSDGKREVVLVLNHIPGGTKLAAQTAVTYKDGYLALLVDNTIKAISPVTAPLTQDMIAFPGLADQPDFSLDGLNNSLDKMKVAGFTQEPPPVGTSLEIWDPMTGKTETAGEETPEEVLRMDITTDKIVLTGDDFASADVKFSQLGTPIIAFRFKPDGAKTFARFTSQHVRQFLAIALDDKIISCPVIKEPIVNGSGIIEGQFARQEATDLVIKLNSGRMPVKLEVVENRTIGPTLGEKTISDSKRAAIFGAILVLVYMALYYRLPGLLADIALIYYISIFFGALSVLNATLTLPGIAGFVLSIGMAVDANVIIFERLKEELKTGKTFKSAMETAFKRAFLAIFDSNVTTLIGALVLYNLGTGPIRGFAVTLSLGILVSMFSALVLTRLLLDATLSVKGSQKYSWFGVSPKDVAVAGKGGGL